MRGVIFRLTKKAKNLIAKKANYIYYRLYKKASSKGLSDTTRMEGGLDLLVGEAFEHQADHAQIDPGLAGGGQELIIFAQAPVASDPGEGALHYPATREELEAREPERRLFACR